MQTGGGDIICHVQLLHYINRLQSEMLSLQEELKELAKEKSELVETHARDIGEYEAQLTALRHKTTELQEMVVAVLL